MRPLTAAVIACALVTSGGAASAAEPPGVDRGGGSVSRVVPDPPRAALETLAGASDPGRSFRVPPGDLPGASPDSAAIARVATRFDPDNPALAVEFASVASEATAVDLQATGDGGSVTLADGSRVDVNSDGGLIARTADGLEVKLAVVGSADEVIVVDGASVQADISVGTDVVARAIDGGAQLIAVLADATAPGSVAFDLTLPAGSALTRNGDGSISVRAPVRVKEPLPGEWERVEGAVAGILGDATSVSKDQAAALATIAPARTREVVEQQEIGVIGAAWAVDARGKALETRYEIDGTRLIQVVITDDSTVFPVVMDPTYWWGWSYWLSNTTVSRIVKSLAAGAGAAGVAAALQAAGIITVGTAAATAIVAAVVAFGAAALDLCNWNDRGVTLRGTWAGGFWCWPS